MGRKRAGAAGDAQEGDMGQGEPSFPSQPAPAPVSMPFGIQAPTPMWGSTGGQVVPPPGLPGLPAMPLGGLGNPMLGGGGLAIGGGLPPVGQMLGGPTPGLPMGAPAPSDAQALQRMKYQQAAMDYEATKNFGIAPEVSEFCEYHGIDERATQALDDEMKRRRTTFDEDMQALWIGLEGAKNPSGLLMIKIRDMRMGNFRGMSALDQTVQDFAKKYRLDAQAAVKLAEVFARREDAEGDLAKLGKHLERSNKPSSLMMMMLKDLRMGKPIKEPEYTAAVGSRVHEKELKTTTVRRSRSRRGDRGDRGGNEQRYRDDRRGRDGDRGGGGGDRRRSRSRGGGGDRDRGSDRDRR